MSHDSEAASHDPHEDGSHDLVTEQTSLSSDAMPIRTDQI